MRAVDVAPSLRSGKGDPGSWDPGSSGGVEVRAWWVAALLWGVAATAAGASPEAAGTLLLVGGGARPAVVMERFAELAGCPEAVVVVVPTASELEDTGDFYRDELGRYGCPRVVSLELLRREQADDPAFVAELEQAGGVWFAGGDQRRITAVMLGTAAEAALRRAFVRGAVVGGTSAGTAVMSDPMITGDGDFTTVRAGAVDLAPGLGLFPGVILDQHFHARQRQNRLLGVVLENPQLVGIGIDEATAVERRADGTIEVLGEGRISIYDARAAQVVRGSAADPGGLGVQGLALTVLLPGQSWDGLAEGSGLAEAREAERLSR